MCPSQCPLVVSLPIALGLPLFYSNLFIFKPMLPPLTNPLQQITTPPSPPPPPASAVPHSESSRSCYLIIDSILSLALSSIIVVAPCHLLLCNLRHHIHCPALVPGPSAWLLPTTSPSQLQPSIQQQLVSNQ